MKQLTPCLVLAALVFLTGQVMAQGLEPIKREGPWLTSPPSDTPEQTSPDPGDPTGSTPDDEDVTDCVSLEGGPCVPTCDSGDCIDESPNHECESAEPGCSDSYLSVSTRPCNNSDATCDEAEDDDADQPSDAYKYTTTMTMAQLRSAKQTLLDRADEEVARVGGYLADIRHDNIFGFRLSDVVNQQALVMLLRLMSSYIKEHGLEITVKLHRESVKSMVAEVLGELVQKYPYKRRRCGILGGVGEGFRWRLGEKLKVEEGLVWNRHMEPMVDASIDGITEDIQAQLEAVVARAGLSEHTTITVELIRCGQAPGGGGRPPRR